MVDKLGLQGYKIPKKISWFVLDKALKKWCKINKVSYDSMVLELTLLIDSEQINLICNCKKIINCCKGGEKG